MEVGANLEWDPVSCGMTSGGHALHRQQELLSRVLVKDSQAGPSPCLCLTASKKQEGF